MNFRKKRTSRGFDYREFTDTYGMKCSIQESSAACVQAIWLGIDDPQPKYFPGNGTGWHDYELPDNVLVSTRMHLDRKTVKKILPVLQKFAETGEL